MLAQFPDYRFSAAPSPEQASWVAEAVRTSWGLCLGDPVDVAAYIAAMGWHVRFCDLEADVGGLQAAMAPTGDGFLFLADRRLTPCQRSELGDQSEARWASEIVDTRLAHELGHVFFYDQSTPGRRLTELSDEEELFCDAFADALTLGDEARAPVLARGAQHLTQGILAMSAPRAVATGRALG